MVERTKITEIKRLLRNLGIPVNLIGYNYIAESVNLMLNSNRIIFLIEIYKNISAKYNVSIESIEISIRHAIKKTVKNNSNIKNIMCVPEDKTISNSIFLNTIKEMVWETLDRF